MCIPPPGATGNYPMRRREEVVKYQAPPIPQAPALFHMEVLRVRPPESGGKPKKEVLDRSEECVCRREEGRS